MRCTKPVKYAPERLKMLINQLEVEYKKDCSSSEINKLKQFLKKLKNLDEKLIIIFHLTFFDKFEILDKYSQFFISLLKDKDKDIETIINDIFSNYNYGNHRKFCEKSYDYYKKSLDDFLNSLPILLMKISYNESFESMYYFLINNISSFGRTSCWDFLERIDRTISNGKLCPTQMYLTNATGPKKGVYYFFNVTSNDELKTRLMNKPIKSNLSYLDDAGGQIHNIILNSNIDEKIKNDTFLIYKLEDALCNFQKGRF